MNNIEKEQEKQELKFKDKEVYADSNFFIFALANAEKEGEEAKRILECTKESKLKIYTSALTIDEVEWIVQHEKDKKTAAECARIILLTPNIEIIDANLNIITNSIDYYEKENLDPRDAIHFASMKSKKLSTILSTDSDFDKIKEIKRIDFTK